MSFFVQQSAPVFPIVSGRQYPCISDATTSANVTIAAVDVIYFYPFSFTRPISFTNGQIWIATGGAASSAKAGIWANSPVSSRPLGAPLYKDDTGVATTASASAAILAFGAGVLAPNTIYWFGAKFTGTLPTVRAIASTEAGALGRFHGLSQGNQVGISFADAYGNANPNIAEAASFTTITTGICYGFLTAT